MAPSLTSRPTIPLTKTDSHSQRRCTGNTSHASTTTSYSFSANTLHGSANVAPGSGTSSNKICNVLRLLGPTRHQKQRGVRYSGQVHRQAQSYLPRHRSVQRGTPARLFWTIWDRSKVICYTESCMGDVVISGIHSTSQSILCPSWAGDVDERRHSVSAISHHSQRCEWNSNWDARP